jgi:hypothetical protein
MQEKNLFKWKECAISVALSVGLITGAPTLGCSAHASPLQPVIPDVSVLISGPPIKDPSALLRYALPIDNKAIREVQKPLEDITDSLKVAGVRALDSVERVSHAFKGTLWVFSYKGCCIQLLKALPFFCQVSSILLSTCFSFF